MAKSLRVLVIGAHPDDCDLKAGGVAAMYAQLGHVVRFVSVTNGDAGHHESAGGVLARRRLAESQAAARVAGIEYQVLDHHDGELLPSLEARRELIALIRSFRPDLIMTHRPNDYHPDHRYTSQLVQDAAYMVTVPNIVPYVPHLATNPVIVYLSDHFQKPAPFTPDVVIDIGPVFETKVRMIHEHTSQIYEWLPYNGRMLAEVPEGEEARLAWLRERIAQRDALPNDLRFHQALQERYGLERAAQVRLVESFEACEYGTPLTEDGKAKLFPFGAS